MHEQDRGDVKILAVIGFVLCGALAVQTFRSYEQTQAPETATSETLQGPGYSIKRSALGKNILEIEGDNIFPFQPPLLSIARGGDRLKRLCGPVTVSNPEFEAVPKTKAYAAVPNSSNCFPRA